MNVIDLFSGAGGMSLGFEEAGHTVVAGVDYDSDAISTYSDNFDHPGIVENLAETDPEDFMSTHDIDCSSIDCVTGGPPCQDFSQSNLSPESRGRENLVFTFAEYVSHINPTYFVMENVRGIKTFNDGEIFEELTNEFENMGYTLSIETIKCEEYGVPQKRRRVFIVGSQSGKYQFPDTTDSIQTVSDALQNVPRDEDFIERNHNSQTIEKYKSANPGDTPHGGQSPRVLYKNNPSWTITVSDGKTPIHPTEPRMLTPREIARLQSFPDWFMFSGASGRTKKCRQIGNAVPPLVAKHLASNLPVV